GQPQELVVTSGARSGLPWVGSPLTGYGARKNSMHSMYLAGVPTPWFMFRHPIHFAPGAMPILLFAPSSPTAVPMVWVPWPWSSQGCAEFALQEALLIWMLSCQL